MNQEGPSLETLLRRLAETPADFLAEARLGAPGGLPVAAVVSDLLHELGGPALTPEQVRHFQLEDTKKDLNRLALVLIGCWLLDDPWFRQPANLADPRDRAARALLFLTTSLDELEGMARAAKFTSDPDRREELARLCLKDLDLRPAGESLTQARDRLTTLSSLERQRVIRAARLAEERASAIRAEMARKAQAEADAKAMRE